MRWEFKSGKDREMPLWNSVKYLAQISKERMPQKQSCNINYSPGLSVLFKNTINRQDNIQSVPGGMCQTSGECSLS